MENDYIIRESKVLSVHDNYMGSRIKVRLNGLDADKAEVEDLPYCFPLLPKLIHVNPKVGEMVLVILEKNGSPTTNRFYIGPVLSQPYFYKQDLYDTTAFSMLEYRKTQPLQHPEMDPCNNGTLPDHDDVALIGRENSDVILKTNEIRLRCGYKEDPTGPIEKRLHFNFIDPAYIQLKYKKLKDSNNKEINSFINIVADRINLLSRDSAKQYALTDQTDLIEDNELLKILDTAHPLIYGDDLVSFLRQFVEMFRRHTHPFSMIPPSLTNSDKEVLDKNLGAMLTDAVRIN